MKAVASWLLVASLSTAIVIAEGNPRVASVAPEAGKAGDTVTLVGENLDKKTVVAVYLSDSSDDYKAQVMEQTAEKIVLKVPRVKARGYNVSIQVRNDILIQPVRFTVSE